MMKSIVGDATSLQGFVQKLLHGLLKKALQGGVV
jgi:hypothetical protein